MRRRARQLALDFGEHRLWKDLPEEKRHECRERLARMLLHIVEAERRMEEGDDDR